MQPRRLLIAFVVAAFVGVGIFLTMAWNATTIDEASVEAAAGRFDDIRRTFGGDQSLLVRQPDGTITARPETPRKRTGDLGHLFVLAYDARDERVIEVDIPFWFFKLKAPAAQFLVRGTGLDLNDLGVSATDLEAQGSCIVLDETTAGGNRLLVWTE